MKNKTAKALVKALETLLNEDKTVVAAKSPHNVFSIKKALAVLKKAKQEIADDTPYKDVKGEQHFVDVPPTNGGDSWHTVGEFKKRKEALKYAQENFGADENGMVCLLSRS